MELFLTSPFAELWEDADPFERAFAIQGENYRDMGDRKTLRFEVKGRGYFIKTHAGVGFGEIFKNLLYLRLPVLGAANEFRAINRLHDLGVDTMTAAAYGRQGGNPAKQKSFLITEALEPTQPLDQYLNPEVLQQLGVRERRSLVRKLAQMTRSLHHNGVNHRDCYLCHFLIDTSDHLEETSPSRRPIYLIDLHRVQIRNRTPGRWRRKDLAGMLYSGRLVGFNDRDALCFMRAYEHKSLRDSFKNATFWKKISREATKLFEKGERKGYHE